MFVLGVIAALFMGMFIGTMAADYYYHNNFELTPKESNKYWGDDD